MSSPLLLSCEVLKGNSFTDVCAWASERDGRDFQLIKIQISEVVQLLSSGSLWSSLVSVWLKDLV